MNSLGGVQFVYNAESQDYCFEAAIASLCAACDRVVVVEAGSSDRTAEILKSMTNAKLHVIYLDGSEWAAEQGKEKLSYFTNKAIDALDTDWILSIQADEVLYERSIPWIRQAINLKENGFMCRRYNLWRDAYSMLNVPQNRLPCSTEVIRLAKNGCYAIGDAESLGSDNVNFDYLEKIEIAHCGFVRDPFVMKKKVTHMLTQVFQMDADPKLSLSDKFEWDHYFSAEDLTPAPLPLPKFVQQWAIGRHGNP